MKYQDLIMKNVLHVKEQNELIDLFSQQIE